MCSKMCKCNLWKLLSIICRQQALIKKKIIILRDWFLWILKLSQLLSWFGVLFLLLKSFCGNMYSYFFQFCKTTDFKYVIILNTIFISLSDNFLYNLNFIEYMKVINLVTHSLICDSFNQYENFNRVCFKNYDWFQM